MLRDKGYNLADIVAEGKSNDEIRAFFKAQGLRVPTRAFLDKYRVMIKSPGKMAEATNHEFMKFLSSKLGIEQVGIRNILDAIIMAGVQSLKEGQQVYITQLLKAIELRTSFKDDGEMDAASMMKTLLGDDDGRTAKPGKEEVVQGDPVCTEQPEGDNDTQL